MERSLFFVLGLLASPFLGNPALTAQDQKADLEDLEKRMNMMSQSQRTGMGNLETRIKALEGKLDEVLEELRSAAAVKGAGKPAEPSAGEIFYDARPLSHWLKTLSDRKSERSGTAVTAIAAIGEPAFPRLREILQGDDWYSRRNVVLVLFTMGERGGEEGAKMLVGAAKDGDARVRLEALDLSIKAFTRMAGERDRLDVSPPPVQKDLAAVESHLAALELALMGAVISALSDENPTVRVRAARGLAELGRKDRPAVEGLLSRLEDKNRWVRLEAALTLVDLSVGESALAVPILEGRVQEKIEELSQGKGLPEQGPSKGFLRVLQALGALGPRAQSAAPLLEKLKEVEEQRGVRPAATSPRSVRQPTPRILRRPSGPYRTAVDEALEKIQEDRPPEAEEIEAPEGKGSGTPR